MGVPGCTNICQWQVRYWPPRVGGVSVVAVESCPVEEFGGSRTKRARYSVARASAAQKTIAESMPQPS